MRMRRLIPWTAPIGVAAAALVLTHAVAFAYPPPPASAQLTSGCSSVTVGSSCAYQFKFFDSGGNPDPGLAVSIVGHTVAGCTLNPTSGTTDSTGSVSTTFSCPSGSGTGTETITATSGTVSASVTVSVAAASTTTLPNTSTNPPGPSTWIFVGIALAVMTLAAGGGYLIRSSRGNRRRPA